jgi:uncharacterized SAM-binding protein YcdF (DUF218 family)
LKRLVLAAARLITLGVILFTGLAIWICGFGYAAKPSISDCIIVLGCRVYGTVASPFLAARLDESLRLYNQGYAGYFVVSGGQGPGEDITEAEAMKRYLVQRGVPADRVILEDRSTSTEENLAFSLERMREHGLRSAIVVSNRYHLLRASIMAKRLGLAATYSGTFLSQHLRSEVTGFARELVGVPYALLFVWGKR